MTDDQLVKLCIKGDRKGQKILYDTYSRRMYSICLRYCSDPAAAADALQNGFIRVYKYIDKYNETGNLSAWIRRIVVNSCLDEIRKRGRHFSVELDDVDAASLKVEMKPVAEQFNIDRIKSMLQKLPLGYRTVFSMSVFDDMNHKEIATSLNISEATSRSQLMRARKMLQEQIKSDSYLASQYLGNRKTYTA
jgi:RNA polymerase sigma-70 factor (ECF subfamily)